MVTITPPHCLYGAGDWVVLGVFGPPNQARAWSCHFPNTIPYREEGQAWRACLGCLLHGNSWVLCSWGEALWDAESGVKGSAHRCCIPEMWVF